MRRKSAPQRRVGRSGECSVGSPGPPGRGRPVWGPYGSAMPQSCPSPRRAGDRVPGRDGVLAVKLGLAGALGEFGTEGADVGGTKADEQHGEAGLQHLGGSGPGIGEGLVAAEVRRIVELADFSGGVDYG